MSKELIEKIKNTFIALDKLKKPGVDARDMEHYNAAQWQIVKIRALILNDRDPSQILSPLQTLQKISLAEVASELPKLIDEKDMEHATKLYEEMNTDVKTIVDALEQVNKELNPQGLSM